VTAAPQDESTGRLIAQATEDISTLIRAEMALAKDDLAQAGKRVGVGAGLFGAAGVIALYGLGVLLSAAVLGLANVTDPWLAALIVAVALFVVAGVAALLGKSNVSKVAEAPAARKESVQADVAAAKGNPS
jgi:membrane protein